MSDERVIPLKEALPSRLPIGPTPAVVEALSQGPRGLHPLLPRRRPGVWFPASFPAESYLGASHSCSALLPTRRGTMASADFCHLFPPVSRLVVLLFRKTRPQISRDKHSLFHPVPARFTTSQSWESRVSLLSASSPTAHGLLSGSCSSGRGSRSGFLQTPPRGDALASATRFRFPGP